MIFNVIGEKFALRTFDDRKPKRPHLIKTFYGTLEEHKDALTELNKQGAGVYATINETDGVGRKKSNILSIRAFIADFDTKDKARTFDYQCPPSLVIESSPGKHHAYWLVDDCPLEDYPEIQTQLSTLLGSDPSIKDTTRVMRVPDYYHHKGDPFKVRVLEHNGQRYKCNDIKTWLETSLELCDYSNSHTTGVGAPDNRDRGSLVHTESGSADTNGHVGAGVAPASANTKCGVSAPYVQIELNRLITRLLEAPEGNRNNTLNEVAYLAFGLVKGGSASELEVKERLLQAADIIGLDEGEVQATLVSSFSSTKPMPHPIDRMPELPNPFPKGIQLAEGVTLESAADLKAEDVHWLWDGWLAQGKIHLIAGSPGTGKTTIALSLAGIVSTGAAWPDGCTGKKPGKVVIWSGEDDISDTLLPRLKRMGANLDNVMFITGRREHGKALPFDPAADMPKLIKALEGVSDIAMLILDPIVSAVKGDSNSNTDVRNSLEPLAQLSVRLSCAVVGVTHLTKGTQGHNATERVTGSIGFSAASRIVLIAFKVNGSDTRMLARAKSNIADDSGGLEYSLQLEHVDGLKEKISGVEWGEVVEGSAEDHLAEAELSAEDRAEADNATKFLSQVLAGGPEAVRSVKNMARGENIPPKKLAKGIRNLGVLVTISNTGERQWELPLV